ncbi:hypothetical protein BJY01DRAFT_225662 [Aspergillus pseudoustus]|uniref:Secreted protein n=1 Tax=Aspergillus pseudoustus TaxID=1810923 RepID=A0ABR4IYF4_9EURO
MPAFMIMRIAVKLLAIPSVYSHLIVSVSSACHTFPFSALGTGLPPPPDSQVPSSSLKHLFMYPSYALFSFPFSDVPSRTVLTAAMMRITMSRYYTVTKMFNSESWRQLSCRVVLRLALAS